MKVAKVDIVEGSLRIAEERALLMSVTIRECVPQLCAAEEARCSCEVALRSAEYELQVFGASASSFHKEVGQIQSDRTCLQKQCDLRARCGGHKRDLQNHASETNLSLNKNIWEFRAQYDRELVDLWYECDGLQVRLATYDSCS